MLEDSHLHLSIFHPSSTRLTKERKAKVFWEKEEGRGETHPLKPCSSSVGLLYLHSLSSECRGKISVGFNVSPSQEQLQIPSIVGLQITISTGN
jgi:hypothetical protein